jgi:hypothetical protein
VVLFGGAEFLEELAKRCIGLERHVLKKIGILLQKF